MKKTFRIFFLITATCLCVISCNSIKEDSIETLEQSVKYRAANTKNSYIFINAASVDNQWKTTNNLYIVDTTTINSIKLYTIDVSAIYNHCISQNTPSACDTSVAEWLKNNDQYIDFTNSYPYIENIHTIDEQTEIYTDGEVQISTTVAEFYDQLKNIFEVNDIASIPNSYDNYISLSLNNSTIQLSPLPEYNKTASCYSIPLLKSVLELNNINENSSLKITFTQKSSCIHFQLLVNSTVKTYDYSDIPKYSE